MNSDGTEKGFELGLTTDISRAVNIPVIASGGAGSMDDFAQAFQLGCADAALAASVFHYGEIQIPELKQYLKAQGISIRI